MSRRRAVVSLVVAAALAAVALSAVTASPTITVEQLDGGSRIDVDPGGPIVSLTSAEREDGRRTVWLIVGPEPEASGGGDDAEDDEASEDSDSDETCPADERRAVNRLIALDPFAADGAPTVRIVADGSAARWVEAIDLDGDGVDELLQGVEDRIERVGGDGTVRALLVDPVLADGRPTMLARAGRPAWLRIAGVGRDRYLMFDATADTLHDVVAVDNRTGVSRHGRGLVIWSPAVAPVPHADRTDGAGPLLAGWPRMEGRSRLQIDLVSPGAEDEAARRIECWGRLPGKEQPLERFVRMLDGAPVAIVTTIPAGGLNLFGEKLLRVFSLRRDRSRRGVTPLLAIETRVNVWQPIEPVLHDFDGDGRSELVLAYWKGLKDDRIVLDTYRRNRAGGFELRPRSVGFDVKRGDRSFVSFGHDASGDGRPDLIIAGDGRLRLYVGTDDPSRAIRRAAAAVLPIGEPCEDHSQGVQIGVGIGGAHVARLGTGGAPLAVDLDGDAAVEMILRRGACDGPPLSIIRFAPGEGQD